MGEAPDTGRLAPLRAEIDACDADLVRLLARRMAIVERVIEVKRRHGIAALLPDRVEEVVARVRSEAAGAGVPPDLVETVWREMMNWVIAYEDGQLRENELP